MPVAWILLRGLGREHGHWFDFARTASDALGVEFTAVDLPGFGRARCERVPTSVTGTAEVVRHRIDGLLCARPGAWGVLGLSLGGMVGLELCRRDPERLSHLVVVNSSSRSSPPWQRLLPEGMLLLSRSLAAADAIERERRIYELTLCNRRREAEAFAERAAEFAGSSGSRRRDVLRQLFAAARFLPQAVAQPVLVLSGRNDRLVSPACSASLAARLSASHVEHPTAGHDLPLDDGPWLAQQVKLWLDRGNP
jgi:pimeloyl-ACP methyl ester carboxylesterase